MALQRSGARGADPVPVIRTHRARFGAILGLMRPAMFPVQIFGVPFAGWMYDQTGSYATAFETFLVLYLMAAVCLTLFKPHQPTT